MPVKLFKPVRRQLVSSDRKGRPLIVTLSPGDIISFRPKGAKRTVSVYIGHCFALAQLNTISHDYDRAMKDYHARKKAGEKYLRKPRKPTLFYDKVYFEALK